MTSRRNYLTIDELEEYADITVTEESEAEDQISQAEELIDAYVGHQDKAMPNSIRGEVSSATSSSVTDNDGGTGLDVGDDYFVGCEIEIIGGTGAGQTRRITASSRSGKSVTVSPVFTTTPNTTSVFKIYQLGKFPRIQDRNTNRAGDKYYRSIPEAVKRATAAQMQYMIEMGSDFFSGASTDMEAENILNYGYRRGAGSSGSSSVVKMIAPKARALLRGIKNSTGRLVVEEP